MQKTRKDIVIGWSLLAVCIFVGCRQTDSASSRDPFEQVNPFASGGARLPIHQVITPAGRQVELPGVRPQVLCLSPDGKLLVTSGKTHELIAIDPQTTVIVQRVPFPPEGAGAVQADPDSSHNLKPDREGEVSFTGLAFSPDGSRIYLSNVKGSIKVFSVSASRVISPLRSIPLPDPKLSYRKKDIPAGLALSSDGKRLYVALNVSNRLLELEAETGKPLRTFDVGNAPFGVILNGNKAYVSNWGGRRVDEKGPVGPIGIGAKVRVDPVRFIANEGSVSVVDLDAGRTVKETIVGMHSSGMALSPDKRHLAVANANSDALSIIDTSSDEVIETISTRWQPTDLFGTSPNAVSFDQSGKTLFVCNGAQNTLAVIVFEPGHSRLQGLIPTAWYPGDVVCDQARGEVYIANIKGVGSGARPSSGKPAKFDTHQYFGTLSLIPVPDAAELKRLTNVALENCQRVAAEKARWVARPDIAPRPVPERVGEPSMFKHVVYIIKENRSYDQVLGDVAEGDGQASFCVFGEKITPNQHKIVRDFVLLDNTYCSGINSADGHQWADAAFTTDYLERSFAGFPRSYPDGMEDQDVDALAYAASGFLWDNVLAHGKTLRDYGEFAISASGWRDASRKGTPTFLDYYRDFVDGTNVTRVRSRPAIPSLTNHMNSDTVGWDLHIPDVLRAARFIDDLQEFERAGAMPDLCMICLPNDHTSGTKAHFPTPAAHVADNDLAFGQIVEAISHSRFWKDTCIIAIEDDPQDGWDHVSGYRTTAYVISPFTKRKQVIHNQYDQPAVLRTIELILGLPPMNHMDATATPMSACFTDKPDFTPYNALPNNIPLDVMNPEPRAIKDPIQRRFAELSDGLPLNEPDQCPEDLLNQILWYAQKGPNVAYPKMEKLTEDKD